ncbi:uncharacterized protein [Spinacia oleracea]|uniref:RNase H type-1 domain-containing protein n=1 Tax=Spinacia oleracea TaxID=3562 RepID=A0ABM3R3H9_SPIOL|nr:uncharacterized protein LOC130465434 [Spinacia oleracea]
MKPIQYLHKAKLASSEFLTIHKVPILPPTTHTPNPNHLPSWFPPPPSNAIKINVDSSWTQGFVITGVAGVAHNSHGQWILGFQGKEMADSSLMAKLLDIRHGLQLAIQQGWTSTIFSSDCKEAITIINSSYQVSGYYINLVLDCRVLKNRLSNSPLRVEGRSMNGLANLMAHKAREDMVQTKSFKLLRQPENFCMNLYLAEVHPILDAIAQNYDENVP